MSTVAQLIEKLKELPQDAIVQVLEEKWKSYSMYTEYSDIDIEFISVIDFTGEEYKNSKLFGKVLVHLEAI